jgi:hypothetical protein
MILYSSPIIRDIRRINLHLSFSYEISCDHFRQENTKEAVSVALPLQNFEESNFDMETYLKKSSVDCIDSAIADFWMSMESYEMLV